MSTFQCTFTLIFLVFVLYGLLKRPSQTIFQNPPGSRTRERMFLRTHQRTRGLYTRAPKAQARKFGTFQRTFAKKSPVFVLCNPLKVLLRSFLKPARITHSPTPVLRVPPDKLENPQRERRRREREIQGISVHFRKNFPRFVLYRLMKSPSQTIFQNWTG